WLGFEKVVGVRESGWVGSSHAAMAEAKYRASLGYNVDFVGDISVYSLQSGARRGCLKGF
ncbi:MAG: hypothetical protein VYA84_20330, partial [Planctomycetota bacterium]|nr:hypothetical protein [Planctomycetota bacterium]